MEFKDQDVPGPRSAILWVMAVSSQKLSGLMTLMSQ